jgi:sugar lactone lactonase YvrE
MAAEAHPERKPLDIRVFARVPSPGQPEPVAIGSHRRVFVGTNQQGKGGADAPSKIFVYSRRGHLRRGFELEGQDLDSEHGIQGLAFDGRRRLYALDRSAEPRVVRINLPTGVQRTYARFRDVPSCRASGRDRNCSATAGDAEAAPDYATFARGGRLYVTDIEQALIWRVPGGGGRPRVWFTDPRLENIFGPNGIQFMANGRTLLFAVTAQGPSAGDPTEGALFKLGVRPDGTAGRLRRFWTSRPFDGPDGFAIGRSGRVYLALAGANQLVVISPHGEEIARVPATPLENEAMEVPMDGPASAAFLGRRLLVTNQTSPAGGTGDPDGWAVFDVFTGERGLPLFRP